MEKLQKITACAFLHQSGKLFIAKRADSKAFLPGKYELPGGHIEFGETMENGLQREFIEEFQTRIAVGDPFHTFTYTRDKDGVALHVLEVIYFATLADKNQAIRLRPEDHSAYQWISAEEIDTYLNPDDEETRAVRKGFQILSQRNAIPPK